MAGPRAQAETGGFELQGDGVADKILRLQSLRQPLAQGEQLRREGIEAAEVGIESGFGRDRLHLPLDGDGASVLTAGETGEAGAGFAVAADQVERLGLLQLPDGLEAVLPQRFGEYPADAID